MDQTKKMSIIKSYPFALRYGLIIGIVPVVYNTLLVLLDLLMEYYGDDPGGSMKLRTQIFILPLGVIWAIYSYKKAIGGFLKLKQALGIGIGVAVVSSIIIIGYHVFFNAFLAPSFHEAYYAQNGQELFKELEACCDYTKEEFENHKNLRLEYDQGKRYLGDIVTPLIIGSFIGVITGLIMSKKNISKPE